jgi:hypothetical protein
MHDFADSRKQNKCKFAKKGRLDSKRTLNNEKIGTFDVNFHFFIYFCIVKITLRLIIPNCRYWARREKAVTLRTENGVLFINIY